ncbi:hypothetical protein [Hydrogenophaga sp.]|uniref:hypothetical protein n=1 Tax=Hydrogenophaga sp. TaxID=1904254 RepID=UPI002634C0C5|nr:hypothetical protein [Hydrogenophaga sp.]
MEFSWALSSGNVQAPGTYSLMGGSSTSIVNSRYAQLLPQSCGTGTLHVASLGVPEAGQTHQFTLFHAPGPSPTVAGLLASPFSCTIDDVARSCTVSGAAGFNAGDAVELQWTNSATIGSQTTPGGIAISFNCT